jgi:hypothetical protein
LRETAKGNLRLSLRLLHDSDSVRSIRPQSIQLFLWIEKGEQGKSPYKEFSEAVTRARGRAKARIVRSLLDEKDWRARLEVLARVFPDEYGRRDLVPLPPPPPEPPPDLSKSIRVTCYGAPDVDLGQFMELKGKLEAAGIKTDFPIRDGEPASHAPLNDDDELEPGEDANG